MQALLLGFFLGFLLPSVVSAVNGNGTQTVLVVAVKTPSSGNSKTKEEISGRAFGDSKQTPGWPNMTGIYETCSYGKLKFIKANDRGSAIVVLPDDNSAENITSGTTTVTLNKFTGTDTGELEKQLDDTLKRQFNVSNLSELANHILFCFPPGMGGGSSSPIGSGKVRMTDDRCLDPFVLAHEFGHSMGLVHSGQVDSSENNTGYNKDEYGDESCMMGHAFAKSSFLQKQVELGKPMAPLPVCFNGLKSWQLGWFEEQHRHTFIRAADTNKWEGKLIGQVDYRKSDGTKFKIILKLENPDTTNNPDILQRDDYYIMFHRVTSPADADYDSSNTVTIVSPKTPENARSQKDNFKVTVTSINLTHDPAFAEVVVEMLGQDTAAPTSTPPTSSPPTTSLPTATTTTAVPTSTPPTTSPPTTSLPTATTTIAVPTTAEPTGSPSNNPTTTVPTARPTKSASTGKSGKSMLGKSTLRGKSGKSIQNTSKSGKSKLGKSTSREPV